MQKNTCAQILDHVLLNGGASIAIANGAQHIMGERDGDVYMVGGASDRDGFSVPELRIPLAELTEGAISFAIDYVKNLAAPNNPYLATGFWVDGDHVCIDASEAIMGYWLALDAGNARGERAMYRLATGETITLKAGNLDLAA